MTLTGKQKNYLRGIAHNLHPIVSIGSKGLTDAVMKEMEIALDTHELVKIKLAGEDKQERASQLALITCKSDSAPVQLIGHVGVIYRACDEPKIIFPS